MANPARSPEYQKFLERLRAAREQSGLLQSDVAAKLNKPQSYVSKCESGERRMDVVELAAIAEIYGVPLTFFAPRQRKTRVSTRR